MEKEYKLIKPPHLIISKDGKNILPPLSPNDNKNDRNALLEYVLNEKKVDEIILFFMQNKMLKYFEKVNGYTICDIQHDECSKSGYIGTTFNNQFNILMFKKDNSDELIKFYAESDYLNKKLFFSANPDNRQSINEGCQPIRHIDCYSHNPKNKHARDETEGNLLPLKIKKITVQCKDGCKEFKDYEFTLPVPDHNPILHYIVSLHTKATKPKIRLKFGGKNYITYEITSIEKWMLANVEAVENDIRPYLNKSGKSQHLRLDFYVWLFPVIYKETEYIPYNVHEKISIDIMKNALTKNNLKIHIMNMNSDHSFVKGIVSVFNKHYESTGGHNRLEQAYLTKPKSHSEENEFRLGILPQFINKNTDENLFTLDEITELKLPYEIKPKNSNVSKYIHEISQS